MTSKKGRVTSNRKPTTPAELRSTQGIRTIGLGRVVEVKGGLVFEPLSTPAEMRGILKGKVRGSRSPNCSSTSGDVTLNARRVRAGPEAPAIC